MILKKIYGLLCSAKLAIALLIAILASCVVGVTIYRGAEAGAMIFSTLWFNSLLVLLVVNVAVCFFPRIWRRKLTLSTFGMILFHLSFVAILGGIVYNGLFYFRGLIRLTEGEVLPSGDPRSYDFFDHGRYFSFSKLSGETTLIKMHKGYKVEGAEKMVAYEVAVGEKDSRKQGTIYITHNLEHDGFVYLREKEGYSLLMILYDRRGREIYGAHVPLQSLKQKDGRYLYITGTKDGPGSLPFPHDPEKPQFFLQVTYRPTPIGERGGDVFLQVWPFAEEGAGHGDKALAEGKAAIGEKFDAGDYYLEAREVRYWVGMNVRYEPGKPIVLTSLWIGLGGMVITFIGRIGRRRSGSKASVI